MSVNIEKIAACAADTGSGLAAAGAPLSASSSLRCAPTTVSIDRSDGHTDMPAVVAEGQGRVVDAPAGQKEPAGQGADTLAPMMQKEPSGQGMGWDVLPGQWKPAGQRMLFVTSGQ